MLSKPAARLSLPPPRDAHPLPLGYQTFQIWEQFRERCFGFRLFFSLLHTKEGEWEMKHLALPTLERDSRMEGEAKVIEKTPEACINLMRFCAFAGG